MKKSIALGTMLLLATGAFAQKSKIRDTKSYLADQDYKKAMGTINEAVNNEDTKNNPEAWYLRGMVYLQQALDSTAKAPNATDESLSSLMKALTLKPDYGPEINNGLYSNALLAFNEGVAAFSKDPSMAYDKFMKVVQIYNVNGGKRFANDKGFTELAQSAKGNAAYAAMNAKRDDEAIAVLNDLKTTTKDSTVYQSLIEIYSRQKNDAKQLETITEARSKFPNSQLFRNLELNYYINKGQTDVLVGKLEEAVKSDPNNAELQFNLANIYEKAAFPKNEKNEPQPKPANYNELFSKAEAAYAKAVAAAPNNADYHYNYGVLYYESATDLVRQMNNIKGMSPAEQKQYDALLAQRDAQFDKALPHLEKAYSLLEPKASSLDANDKITYQNTLIGLREIYSRKNNKAKTDELKAKMDALKK